MRGLAPMGWPVSCRTGRMETFNDPDFIFLLVDVFVLAAGVFAVGAWFVDHRRHAQRERARRPMIMQGE